MSTESLTIEIQGDSSGLAEALNQALTQIQSLQNSADDAVTFAEGISSRLSQVSTSLTPLGQVQLALSRISQQAAAIGQQPITLNVESALASLSGLMQAIEAVAAALRLLSVPNVGLSEPGGSPGQAGVEDRSGTLALSRADSLSPGPVPSGC